MEHEAANGYTQGIYKSVKVEAVRLVKEQGISIAQACRDLDIHDTVLRSWIKDQANDPENALETRRENREQRRRDGGENAGFGVVTLARQRRISVGNRQKKSQPDKG